MGFDIQVNVVNMKLLLHVDWGSLPIAGWFLGLATNNHVLASKPKMRLPWPVDWLRGGSSRPEMLVDTVGEHVHRGCHSRGDGVLGPVQIAIGKRGPKSFD